MSGLRTGDWLDASRILSYSRALLVLEIVFAAVLIFTASGLLGWNGVPIGADFVSFWTASLLANAGHPEAAYMGSLHYAAQQSLLQGRYPAYFAFLYPPTYLLVCLPLALLPYGASLLAWLTATGYGLWRVVRTIIDRRDAIIPMMAFPAIFLNLGYGQNAFLTTALFGAAILNLERRPVLSGALFGCLSFKPQLALMVPLALSFGRHWKVLFAAAAAAISLAVLSLAVLGSETWRAFLDAAPLARRTMEQHLMGAEKLQSVFGAVQVLHGDIAVAWTMQATSAILAAATLLWAQLRHPASTSTSFAMVTASLLATPFVLDYDLVLLAVPIAWLVREGLRGGFLPYEKVVVFCAYLLPMLSQQSALRIGVPIAPVVLTALHLSVLQRIGKDAVARQPASLPPGSRT